MSDHPAPNSDSLIESALLLLAEVEELSAFERERRLREWSAQSDEHVNALRTAEAEWAMFGRIEDQPLSLAQRSRLGAEVVWANAVDRPLRVGGTLGMLAVGLFTWNMLISEDPETGPVSPITAGAEHWTDTSAIQDLSTRYRTGWHEQRELTLSDGSHIWLNWNTEILVFDNAASIHVDVIVGDVMFAIAEGAAEQFVVHAGQALAYPSDTEFAIHSHGVEDAFFQVKRGLLSIASPNQEEVRRLKASQQSYYARGKGGRLSETNLNSIAAWRDGKLVFDDRPLVEILGELSHFIEYPLQIGPIADSEHGITATYAMRDANEVLMQLADAYGLELLASPDDGTIVRSIDNRRL